MQILLCTVQYWRVYAVYTVICGLYCTRRGFVSQQSFHNDPLPPSHPTLGSYGDTLELRKLKHIIDNRYIYALYEM